MASTEGDFLVSPNQAPAAASYWSKCAYPVLVFGIVFNTLAAYSVGPIPLEWIGKFIVVGGALMCLAAGALPRVPEFLSLVLLFEYI